MAHLSGQAFRRGQGLSTITIPPISDDVYEYFEMITKSQLNIRAILVSILRSGPDSDVKAITTEKTVFATWTKKMHPRKAARPKYPFGLLQRHPEHKTAWAIIAAKLISIASFYADKSIHKTFTDYSAQYLLDFVKPQKQVKAETSSCCKINSVAQGIAYAVENDIPRQQDWNFRGCRNVVEQFYGPLFSVKGEVQSLTLTSALICIQHQPVAAKLHLFKAYEELAQDEIYRGPTDENLDYIGEEDVMIYETTIVEDELVAVVKLPCGKKEYLNVSVDVMLILAPRDDNDADDLCHKNLEEAGRLLKECMAILPPRN